MAIRPGTSGPRYTVYDSAAEYNLACPDAPLPTSVTARDILRGYTYAGAGLQDDLMASSMSYTLGFLPGGAPELDEVDRIGMVVASQWGGAPYLVLAEHMSLRGASRAVMERWPAELSTVIEVLQPLTGVAHSDAEVL